MEFGKLLDSMECVKLGDDVFGELEDDEEEDEVVNDYSDLDIEYNII